METHVSLIALDKVMTTIHSNVFFLFDFTDFSTLWPERIRSKVRADVLNGISVSADPDILYVTGKNWDRMFRLKLN